MRTVDQIKNIGVVGCGLIGTGWVIQFLSAGYKVSAFDSNESAQARVIEDAKEAWPYMAEFGLSPSASIENLTFASSLEEVCRSSDFIQESLPEDVRVKQGILQKLDQLTHPDVLISSSTSGIIKSVIEQKCHCKDRIIVGHPFLPVHLIPLVEVVASTKVVSIAEDLYTKVGKVVVVLNKEVPGFIGNRFQETILREALHMVAAGEATPEQIDIALMNGPALRWPFMGPFMSVATAHGRNGIQDFLKELDADPTAEDSWTRMSMPEVTSQMKLAIESGITSLFDGRSYDQRMAERNKRISEIRKVIRPL